MAIKYEVARWYNCYANEFLELQKEMADITRKLV